MIKFIFLLLFLFCLGECQPLIRQKKWKMLVIWGMLTGLALLIGLGKLLGLPTPIELLDHLLRPVGKTFLKRF